MKNIDNKVNQNHNDSNLELLHTTNSIRTFSGIYVDVFSPKPEMFVIEDIAHALSHMCRFGGHTPTFYSVAEHSINVMKRASPEFKLEALLHDATEAYIMDMPKPIKRHLKDYNVLEDKLMKVIADKFNIPYPFSPQIKELDLLMLEFEWENIILKKNPKSNYVPMKPEHAKEKFLFYYYKLMVDK